MVFLFRELHKNQAEDSLSSKLFKQAEIISLSKRNMNYKDKIIKRQKL